MSSCRHTALELLPARQRTLRCRRCHLTIDAAELGDDVCPECFDRAGERHYDFEALEETESRAVYRCEECGALVRSS